MSSLPHARTVPNAPPGATSGSRLRRPHPAVVGVVLHRGVDTYVEQCVMSLKSQTFSLAAIVVAHIGPSDPPAWICRTLSDVHVLSASGPASTAAVVEEIIATCPADGYLFQEATDWSAPDRLQHQLRTARAAEADLVGSDFVVVAPRVPDAHTRVMPPDGNLAFERGNGGTVVEPSTMLVDGALIERLGGFNTNLAVAAANEFVARAAAVARVVNVSRPVCFIREHHAPDWSSGSSGDTVVSRVVAAALSERSRHHAVSLARRQLPDVAMHEPRRRIELVHVGGPPTPIALPAAVDHPCPATAAPEPPGDRAAAGSTRRAPIFVVSAFDSLSRFITCCLGQHEALQAVEVTPWMAEVAQLSARFLEAERRGDAGGRLFTAATAEAVYRAASAAVDSLFVGGPFADTLPDGAPSAQGRWVGAIPADRVTMTSAALLYPQAVFLHVTRPVDEAVAAQLEAQDDADVDDMYTSWLAATQTILDVAQLLEPGRMVTLRYDRLLERPARTIEESLRELGEAPAEACAALFVRSGADSPASRRPITDLAGVPAQQEARRLSIALSGQRGAAHGGDRSYLLARTLTEPRVDTGRRRRATDIVEDDRNPYVASHDLVRRHVAKDAVVCVVSKGDEMAVRIRGHSVGWHFPQTEDGAYAGYHPADAREAIAHLEHLRDRGARYFLIPTIFVWWLNHYTELRMHLERTYTRVPSGEADEGVLFDLAVVREGQR